MLPEAEAEFSGRYADMSEKDYKESILKDLLTNQLPKSFGKTPLENFGAKLQNNLLKDKVQEYHKA